MGASRFVWLTQTRNPWQHINNNAKWAEDAALQGMSADVYQAIYSIGMGLIGISYLVLWLRWALYTKQSGSINKRNEIVGPFIFKFFMVILITALPYLIGEVFRIINQIAKSIVS